MLWTIPMSGCFTGPYVAAYDPPIDCAIEVYKQHEDLTPPHASVLRGGQVVDVTGTVDAIDAPDLGFTVYTVDCDGNPVSHTRDTMIFDHFRVSLAGAQVGEMLYVQDTAIGIVRDAGGICPAFDTLPEPGCSGMYDWSVCEGSGSGSGSDSGAAPSETNDNIGCTAGGSSGLVVALGVIGWIALRRRRS